MNNQTISERYNLSNVIRKEYLNNEYFICEKKNESLQHALFAQYIFFPLAKNKEYLLDENNFLQLQQTILAPLFFQNRNDMRWNIYLLFLIDEDVSISSDIKYRVENDENYARKHIILESEVDSIIMCETIFKKEKKQSKVNRNFIEEWELILTEADLSGCLYNDISTESVRKYIEEYTPIRPVGRPTSKFEKIEAKKNYLVKRIQLIKTSDYRPLCLGKELMIKPGKVNLFSGSNGCGKTSVCEAIEFALTGEIRRNSNVIERGSVSIEVEGNDSQDFIMNSIKDTKEKKRIDNAWYGTFSTSLSRTSELNSNFSTFNHLDSRSTNRLFDSNERNIQEIIKNIVIGEDIIECEKRINKFIDKFMNIEGIIKKETRKVEEEIDKLAKQIEDTQKNITVIDTKYATESLATLFGEDVEVTNADNNNEKYLELISISSCVDRLEGSMQQEFSNISYDELVSMKVNSIIELKSLTEEIEKNAFDKKEREQRENRILEIENETSQIEREHLSLDKFNDEYQFSISRAKELGYTNLQSIVLEYSEKYSEFQILSQIIPDEVTENVKLLDDFDLQASESILQAKEKIDRLQIDLKEMNARYSQQIKDGEKRSILLEQLIAIVNESDDSCCPLCGINHNSSEELRLKIGKVSSNQISGNKIRDLIKNIDEKKEEVRNLQSDLLIISEREKRTRLLISVFEKLKFNGIEDSSTDDVVNTIKNALVQFNELKRDINNMESIYMQSNKIVSNDMYLNFVRSKIDTFESFYDREIQRMSAKILECEMERTCLFKVLEKDNDKVYLEKNYANLLNCIEKNKEALNSINFMINSIDTIAQKYGAFYMNSDLSEWIGKYRIVLSLFEHLHNQDEKITVYSDKLKNKNDKLYQLEGLNLKNNRCKKALTAFSKLAKTDDYLKEFLNENAQNIELIFGMIHRPKEFSNLTIEEGKISFVRSNESKKSAPNQMSTGQSVALAISLLLSLFSSAYNAPQVLIFDEPIANMDDLHMMNLIDLLRAIAISGTQIFVTTANEDVAGLIRRKFSFFGSEFKHFNFERCDSNIAVIQQIEYDPYKECIDINIVS